jgi:phenylalanyl-tRNA synthetase alpha chain
MVHPNVFAACGIDAERYTGWAFGFGIDRMACLLHGVPDLRLLFDGDVRFLEQFPC